MSLFKTVVLVLVALASTDALATHHNARGISHHHALGRRMPQLVDPEAAAPIRRRNLRKRCRVRPSLEATVPVANVGADPTPSPTKAVTVAPSKPTRPSEPAAPRPPKPTKEAPSSGGNFPDFMSGTNTGEATYYAPGLGSCGVVSGENEDIVAVSHLLYDSYPGYKGGNPNNNPVCGRKIKATLHGKTIIVTVVDRCTGCKVADLDFSPGAFNKIGSVFVGREKGMTWEWL